MPRLLACLFVCLLAGACSSGDDGSADAGPLEVPRIRTPPWAFEPWISKDISDGADTRAFVDGFLERGIPVGVVVLDSPWETHYNTFVPNPDRYPDFDKMVKELRGQGVRTVLWVTQMVNDLSFDLEAGGDTYVGSSPNFDEGFEKGYFVNGGETYSWWKGTGAGVDFFNPEAVTWWRKQQDALLEAGVAGWKLDFGEEYIREVPIRTFAGAKTRQEYSEAYYRDFWEYGASKLGTDEFVTMVRPWDESYGMPGRFFARPEHAPVCWVGDNRRDWVGLVDALHHMFKSAARGYVVVGSDIGGYLDRDDLNLAAQVPFDAENFLRWTALGAMTPFMQLHGRANLTPWNLPERSDEAVEAWRYWGNLHSQMVPFFYSLAEEAYAGGPNLMRPIGTEDEWDGDWRFTLGEAFLVAAIFDATGVRDVKLPEGARWYDWWKPEAGPLEGGATLEGYDVGRSDRIPVFLREGAIVPMRARVLVVPGAKSSSFVWHPDAGKPATIQLDVTEAGHTLTLPAGLPRVVEVLGGATGASVDGQALPEHENKAAFEAASSGVWRDGPWLKVRLPASTSPVTVSLSST